MKTAENTILVVDDDPMRLSATARILERAGYCVIITGNGGDALALAETHAPDLILLGIVLPDRDGFEVCRTIKESPATSGIFVTMVSGQKISSTDQPHSLEIGADDYIVRPIEKRELLARVRAMLRIR